MPKRKRKRRMAWIGYLFLLGAMAGGVAYFFRPVPIVVETQRLVRGSLRVTIHDDGRTRIKEKYVVSSPLAGRLQRVELEAGDAVQAGVTLIATLHPAAPALLDVRSRREAAARVKAAEKSRDQAVPLQEKAKVAARVAGEEFARAKGLHEEGTLSHEELDRAELRMVAATEELKAAQFALQVAEHELELAQAALMHVERADNDSADDEAWAIRIRSPITGRVLRVLQESAAVVAPGTPIVELGDTTDLEVVVDVLSSDAVAISPGDPVVIEQWGGDQPLHGRVRLVEPGAFTKISALGVEEQRVNVILDLIDTPGERKSLGDDYRVEASIIVDQVDDVVVVPNSAIIQGPRGAVAYVVERGRARLRPVTLGRRSQDAAEVLSGLSAGDTVIVYPGDQVHEGARVETEPYASG